MELSALFVLLVYLVPFLVLGYVAKTLIDSWMARKGATLSDIQAQAGPNRRKGAQFLLGFWRRED
ncbi:MAG: hypothetical protein Q8M19_22755 [Reyranella sp.]|nr:hypothetical protein [Reyranella sp.]